MINVSSIQALRSQIKEWRQQGKTIGFVPTMGNLHQGHLALVKQAQTENDKVIVSIFVNPTQFGPNEDFERYPRTLSADTEKLEAIQTDLLFLPPTNALYPHQSKTSISIQPLSTFHCGQQRPGHFDGVALIVCKLLNLVQPDDLFMGEKDFQQLTLIRIMVEDLNMPVKVHGIATLRETDGLAMSSRNAYLSPEERRLAPLLYQTLSDTREAIQTHLGKLEPHTRQAMDHLEANGISVEYLSVCDPQTLEPLAQTSPNMVLLAAIKIGSTRLIDNLIINI